MHEGISLGTRRLMHATILLGVAGCLDGGHTEPSEAAAQQAAPTPAEKPQQSADISAVSVAGSGCPSGTSRLFVYDDGFHLTFDAFELSTAQGNPPTASKLCTVSARVPGVAGWSYSVSRVGVSGGASLASDGVLSLSVEVGFTGSATSLIATRSTVQGPHIGRFRAQGEIVDRVWSSCGASSDLVMKIPAALRSTEPALSYVNSLTLELSWRRCSSP